MMIREMIMRRFALLGEAQAAGVPAVVQRYGSVVEVKHGRPA